MCKLREGQIGQVRQAYCPTLGIAKNVPVLSERVGDGHASTLLPILKVFTVKNVTLTFDRRGDNQRIVPSQPKPGSNPRCFSIQSWRGMYRQEWTKRGRQILFRVWAAHGLRKAAQRNIKELLHHLIAENSAARLDSLSDQLRGLRCFLRRTRVEGIHKDICIKKELTAHSSRPG